MSAKVISDFNLPLDVYEPSPQEEQLIIAAERILLRECLQSLGYREKVILPVRYPFVTWRREMRASVLNERIIRRDGFEPEPKEVMTRALEEIYVYWSNSRVSPVSPSEGRTTKGSGQLAKLRLQMALFKGDRKSYKGTRVPPGGCSHKVRETLSEGSWPEWLKPRPVALMNYVLDYSGQARHRMMEDSRFLAVRNRWAKCMNRKGYDYATPKAAIEDKRWETDGEGVSMSESKAALADVNCMKEINYMGVVLSLRAAYEQRIIANHRSSLEVIEKLVDTRVKNAKRVVKRLSSSRIITDRELPAG